MPAAEVAAVEVAAPEVAELDAAEGVALEVDDVDDADDARSSSPLLSHPRCPPPDRPAWRSALARSCKNARKS